MKSICSPGLTTAVEPPFAVRLTEHSFTCASVVIAEKKNIKAATVASDTKREIREKRVVIVIIS